MNAAAIVTIGRSGNVAIEGSWRTRWTKSSASPRSRFTIHHNV